MKYIVAVSAVSRVYRVLLRRTLRYTNASVKGGVLNALGAECSVRNDEQRESDLLK